jgi:RNA polymerase sigma-70 factor (ECF subfamily)
MPHLVSDEQLIKSSKSGDKAAVSQLYERYVDRIYRYVAYRVPVDDAEDLTAEVFVRMVEGLATFEYTGAPFESWLYRIAAARIADFHRLRARKPIGDIDESMSDSSPQPEERLMDEQEQKRVREALLQLDPEDQQLLILRFVERKSHKEVAEIMEKNEAAIRTAQHRALKKLAKFLGSNSKAPHYLRGKNEPDVK